MSRQILIQQWLETVLAGQSFALDYLPGDASFRRYARVRLVNGTSAATLNGPASYMLMDAPPAQEDCAPFVQIDEFLANHGVRVPRIVAQDLTQGLLLLEDFGDTVLSMVLSPDQVDHFYGRAFEQLTALQAIDASHQLPEYTAEKLRQEMQLFDQWLLPSLDIPVDDDIAALLGRTYDWIVAQVLTQPQVVVHRDFHSRNLMVLPHEAALGVIDFQDAVVGPDTYDLISLIRDAYVQWPSLQVDGWIARFFDAMPEQQRAGRNLKQFYHDTDVMTLQRHLKVLGIFVRLYQRDGKAGYLPDLPRVMWYVQQALARQPELAEFASWLLSEVQPRFEQRYGSYQPVENNA